MIDSKKALESYILVILGISLLMSVLLFFIIGIAYESDNELCREMTFTYDVACKQPSGYAVSVENLGTMPISFEMNGNIEDEYYLNPGQSRRVVVTTEDNSAKVIPIVFDENDESYFCKSKQEKTNVEVLGTC